MTDDAARDPSVVEGDLMAFDQSDFEVADCAERSCQDDCLGGKHRLVRLASHAHSPMMQKIAISC
jgi:hypothetical protein